MKKIVELTIDRMTFGGEALASYRGKKVFLPWGVPGDRAKVELIEEKKDFARGRIMELLEKSSHREFPPCPYFFKCGGCQWQQVKYESQVRFKNEILKEALQRIAKIQDPRLLEPLPSPAPLHYRNRIRLQLSRQGELGFFKPQSKEVVSIDRCLIAEDVLNGKIPEAKNLSVSLLQKDRTTRHEIEIRKDPGGLVVEADPVEEAPFAQVNESQNARLIDLVLESLNLKGEERVLELFAGEGNFSFPISEKIKEVVAVEMSEASVIHAEERIQREHRRNLQFIQSTAFRYLEDASRRGDACVALTSFDRILLDPPRKGAVECLEVICEIKVPVLVYVSCDPSTLARDLKILMERGYKHDFSQVIDMFPQTYHVESVTRMVLKGRFPPNGRRASANCPSRHQY